jgi:hypothetical protein
MWSNTKACITNSCVTCALLRYYTAWSGNSLPTFQDNLLVAALRVKKSKQENIGRQKLNVTIFFEGDFDNCLISQSSTTFWKLALILLSCKNMYPGGVHCFTFMYKTGFIKYIIQM